MCERGGKKSLLKTGSGSSQNRSNNGNQESYLFADWQKFLNFLNSYNCFGFFFKFLNFIRIGK